ncbi:MAG: YihA family ribosome biogenesis GTP-binding protein, partial [Desulfuromonadales bacterium]
EDLAFLDWLEEGAIPTIPVITKVDKISRNEQARRIARISRVTGLDAELFTLFSVPDRRGREDLWELISSALTA